MFHVSFYRGERVQYLASIETKQSNLLGFFFLNKIFFQLDTHLPDVSTTFQVVQKYKFTESPQNRRLFRCNVILFPVSLFFPGISNHQRSKPGEYRGSGNSWNFFLTSFSVETASVYACAYSRWKRAFFLTKYGHYFLISWLKRY